MHVVQDAAVLHTRLCVLLRSTLMLSAACIPLLQVYDPRTAQIDIFEITAKPIIDAVLDGYNGEQAMASNHCCSIVQLGSGSPAGIAPSPLRKVP